jgi:trehalose synthase
MLQEISLGQKSLADYTHIAGKETIERIRELAEPMKGHRVLHVSATAFGGGVSEILYTIVPLMRDIGIDAHWHVIFGKEEFYNATKLLHNSLQGSEETLSDSEWALFDEINAINAEGLQGEWDTIIVHDPQPIGLKRGAQEKSRNWI